MKFDRCYEIERVVSTDPTRPALAHCYLDVDAQRLIATDAHALAMIPVTGLCAEMDTAGFVAVDAIRQARSISKRQKTADVIVGASDSSKHTLENGATTPRPTEETLGAFPPYQNVIPSYRRGDPETVTIGITPEILWNLARALGRGNGPVTLTFPSLGPKDKMLKPIVVEAASGALGILMPAAV